MEKGNECKICGSNLTRSLGHIINGKYPQEFLDKYYLQECKHCGLKFISPTPSDKTLEYIYSDQDYGAQWDSEKKEEPKSIRWINFEYYSNLVKKYIFEGKVLDCGCATGTFLDLMKQNGFDCYGIETSKMPFEIVNKKYPGKIYQKNLEDLNLDTEFNLITMFDFIEHVKYPQKVLRQASSLLGKNGYLVIVTPDTKSLSALIMGKRHNDYIMEHLNLFNRKNIKYLLNKCGFKVVKTVAAKKVVNFDFVEKVFKRHTNFLYYPINFVNKWFPERLTHYPIKLSFGGMLIIAKKVK